MYWTGVLHEGPWRERWQEAWIAMKTQCFVCLWAGFCPRCPILMHCYWLIVVLTPTIASSVCLVCVRQTNDRWKYHTRRYCSIFDRDEIIQTKPKFGQSQSRSNSCLYAFTTPEEDKSSQCFSALRVCLLTKPINKPSLAYNASTSTAAAALLAVLFVSASGQVRCWINPRKPNTSLSLTLSLEQQEICSRALYVHVLYMYWVLCFMHWSLFSIIILIIVIIAYYNFNYQSSYYCHTGK